MSIRNTYVSGRFIPAGTNVDIDIWALNRLPSLWKQDPHKFLPERWIDDSINGDGSAAPPRPNNHGGRTTNYAMCTFLHGPRNCFGQAFARAELRVLLAMFVEAFEFELARKEEDVVPYGFPTVKPKGGLWLRIRRNASRDCDGLDNVQL